MSGTLSKIEALDDDDVKDDGAGAEAVSTAVDRVFGAAYTPETSFAAPEPKPETAPSDLGTPMPPIQDRAARPQPRQAPPSARREQTAERPRGPRPNINIDREKAAEAAPQPKPQTSQPPQAKRQPVQESADQKRMPPRLRKKQEEEARKAAADAKKARQQPPPPPQKTAQPAQARAPQSAPPPRTPVPQPAPPPQAPQQRQAPPQPAPPPQAPAPKPAVGGAMPPPPMLPPMPGQAPQQPAAGGTPPIPPMPPKPPTGGAGTGDAAPRPMPMPEAVESAHSFSALASLKEATDLSNCLMPLLRALNWRGDPRHIAEALPHFTNSLDITSFRNIMATLHYQSRSVKLRLSSIDVRLFPCLFLPEDGDAMVLMGYEPGGIRVYHGGDDEEKVLPRGLKDKGTTFFFSPIDADDLQSAQSKVGWFRTVSERYRSLVYQTLGITFILNILALVTPLFVMAVYDKVVATGSLPTLAYFAFGVSVAIGCDLILRGIRSKIMAFIGARLDNIVGIAIFHKILFLPPAFTERATIGAQVARIKDFETIRDFFTGPIALVLFELPFVVIFIVTIAALAGPVVFVSIIMMACFMILGLIITPLLRNSVGRAARASSKKQELIVETLSGMRAVKYCGAETRWMERFREYSATAALNSFYTAQLSSLMQTISHVLMISAGLGTIIFGVFRVINGDMTVGGLVASMILVWRVLAPLQTAFVSLTRLTQVKSSISQINNLMNIRGERDQHAIVNPIKQMEGFVTFARVSIRYSPESDPALVGVSFELEPGEVLCIVGGNGSGKSTALKLLAGMYAPQAGSIRIDNMDIRQMDTVELRHAVAYVPQIVQFFYGTIAQNLRLAHPTATLEDLYAACERAEVLDDILALEQGSGKWRREGFEVRIGDQSSGQMPTSLLQRLNLARGYLKKSPIILFDEPGNGLDFKGDQAFMRTVDAMRGETTVLMVTHRPSHLKLADKILWLEYGNVRAFGPAAEVLQQMPKDFV